MLIIFSLILAFLIYLFSFYYYAREDLFFIRKGATMEYLFNTILIGLFSAIVFSRVSYYLFIPRIKYTSLLKFTSSMPDVGGFSIFGGFVALFATYAWITRRKKIPRSRFLDYISVALLASMPVFFLGVFLNFYLSIMYLILFIFFKKILLPKFHKGTLKAGNISLIFMIMVSLVFLLQDFLLLYRENVLLSQESFLFLGLFVVSCVLLVRLETRKSVKS